MVILCDTSAILMLLRIAPEMFIDPLFECVTIRDVYNELIQTPKFKTKYPWLKEMRDKLKSLPLSKSNSSEVQLHYETVTALNNEGYLNLRTQKFIDLSREDRRIIACAAANKYGISSGDGGLCDFASQQFDLKIFSALEVINSWLEKGLIVWNDEKHNCLKLWAEQNERPQPAEAKRKFKELAKRNYVGS